MTNIIKKENGHQPVANSFGSVVDQIFQHNLTRFFDDAFWNNGKSGHRAVVPVNLRETDAAFELELVAPGLKKDDFKLQVTRELLTISFEQAQQNNAADKDGHWVRREYQQQSFLRSFNLDETIDADNIAARYEDGILKLSLPKKPHAQHITRQISVN